MHQSFVVDASVAVQWLNTFHETAVDQSLTLLKGSVEGVYDLIVPDLLLYEVSNALVRGKGLQRKSLENVLDLLFSFPLQYVWATHKRVASASLLASIYDLSMYDAVYAALAMEYNAPLITTNIKHQGRVKGLHVIDIQECQNWTS